MKLKTVQVTNFRSVEDSDAFEIGDVTCLVGKNEAGKSAILLALAALNPHPETPAALDKERDYPRRHLNLYSDRHLKNDAIAVTTQWTLDDDELSRIAAAVGAGALKSPNVTVFRRYGGELDLTVDLDYGAAIAFLFDTFKLDATERAELAAASTTSQLLEAVGELETPSERQTALQAHLTKRGNALMHVNPGAKWANAPVR